ncbi:MAG: hypothetical protein JKY37_17085 [Nannocystaceae bacterium]|nr:hypothetical protein [Nannocystaceae bacterium]
MRFWTAPFVPNVLTLLALLAVAALLVRLPGLRRIGVPSAILAGLIGLGLGPSAADVLPVDTDVLEVMVYHAFAVVFIAVGLQSTKRIATQGSARSMAFGIASFGVAQALLGFILVGAWLALTSTELHPGFSWMVLLGFMQGPGQALALGSAWEGQGLVQGGQLGLIFAAIGFAHCIVLGVPLVAIAKRRGWLEGELADAAGAHEEADNEETVAVVDEVDVRRPPAAISAEPLSTQLLLIATVYVAMFAVLYGATRLLPAGSPINATLWGFHFILGSGLAIGLRALARRTGHNGAFDNDLLARISVIAVDITTAGAIAAVRLEVLTAWLGPILFMTTIAGGLTLVVCVWASRRIFPDRPVSHALVLLGASTGTISTGLALLRMVDPGLKGPVARNVVVAATASIPLNAPLFLAVIPFAVGLWPSGYVTAMVVPAAVLAIYLVVLLAAFGRMTPARLLRPLTSFWPPLPRDPPK